LARADCLREQTFLNNKTQTEKEEEEKEE